MMLSCTVGVEKVCFPYYRPFAGQFKEMNSNVTISVHIPLQSTSDTSDTPNDLPFTSDMSDGSEGSEWWVGRCLNFIRNNPIMSRI